MIGRTLMAAAGVVLSVAFARAEPTNQAVDLCNLIANRTTAYIKAGDLKRARVNKPYLERCVPILKTARDEQVSNLLNAVTAPRSDQKPAPGR